MKFFLTLLFLGASALAADYPPRFAYLVVPPTTPQPSSTTSTPEPNTTQPQQDEKENLQAYNEEIMERLRQEMGSEGGVYHIYLPDGRLQRVQYTAAPVRAGEQAEVPKNEKQTAGSDFSGVQGFYYVQVPEERFQELRAAQTTPAPRQDDKAGDEKAVGDKSNNQTSQTSGFSAQYTENAAANVNAEFVPVKFVTFDQLSQLRSSAVESSGRSPTEPFSRQTDKPAQYLASLQYSEVLPIQAPVFSYSPDQLVRILRQA